MRAALLAPGVALRFLTIIPLRVPEPIPERAYPRAVSTFPLVGLALGATVALADAVMSALSSSSVAAAVDLALLVVLSGALHIDGVADSADGLLADLPRERRLEVMREPTVGTYGVVAVTLVMLTEYAALASLAPVRRVAALIVAAALARWAMALALWIFPYARRQGLGTTLRAGLGAPQIVIATLTAALAAVLAQGGVGLLLMVVAGLAALGIGALAQRQLGGCTGDVYGAAGEIAFAVVLLGVGMSR